MRNRVGAQLALNQRGAGMCRAQTIDQFPRNQSGLIARELVDGLRATHAGTTLVERELRADTIPHLSLDALAAAAQPPEARGSAARAAAALADRLIAEVEAAGILVIAAPMYNFSIPSTLKAWIDHITRA